MEKKRLIILDFDGTIGDTRSLIVKTMQQVIAELQLPPRTDAECAAMIGLPLRQTFIDLIPMDEATGDLCEQTYRRIFAQNNVPSAVTAFPHTVETIRQLCRQGYTVTIASSRSRQSLLEFVEAMGLAGDIRYVLGADDITHAKPAPEPVLKTLHDLGCLPEDAVVVGDMTFDILMGQRAGCTTVGVTYGNGTYEQLEEAGADHIISDFAELLHILS